MQPAMTLFRETLGRQENKSTRIVFPVLSFSFPVFLTVHIASLYRLSFEYLPFYLTSLLWLSY